MATVQLSVLRTTTRRSRLRCAHSREPPPERDRSNRSFVGATENSGSANGTTMEERCMFTSWGRCAGRALAYLVALVAGVASPPAAAAAGESDGRAHRGACAG